MKKITIILLSVLFLTGCSTGISKEDYNSLQSEKDTLQSKLEALQSEYDTLNANYQKIDKEYQEVISNSIATMTNNAKDDLFADLIMQGLQINYTYDGTMLYDGAAQINIVSEKSPKEELEYIINSFTDGADVLNSLMDTYELGILYFKVVKDTGVPIFEFTYINDKTNNIDASMSLGMDYLDILSE